jgi:tetratricopeptide (TPR) repeat protein
MKTYTNLTKSLIVILIMFTHATATAQDSLTMARAATNFQRGLDAYNQGNYHTAINYLNQSINAVPKAVTYYLISNVYAKSYDYDDALTSINLAFAAKPPLNQKFAGDANKIKTWAINEQKIKNSPAPQPVDGVQISQSAITVPPNFTVPASNENPYKQLRLTHIPSPKPRVEENPGWRFSFPGGGRQNMNGTIGDFCCTGETGTILNSGSEPIGYIYFFGFEGGMNLGNGRSAASKLRILLSGAQNTNDTSSPRLKDEVDFSGSELRPGFAKYQTVGALRYKVIIVSLEKYGESWFMMDNIKVEVDVFN